jgi:hypothetical protein
MLVHQRVYRYHNHFSLAAFAKICPTATSPSSKRENIFTSTKRNSAKSLYGSSHLWWYYTWEYLCKIWEHNNGIWDIHWKVNINYIYIISNSYLLIFGRENGEENGTANKTLYFTRKKNIIYYKPLDFGIPYVQRNAFRLFGWNHPLFRESETHTIPSIWRCSSCSFDVEQSVWQNRILHKH